MPSRGRARENRFGQFQSRTLRVDEPQQESGGKPSDVSCVPPWPLTAMHTGFARKTDDPGNMDMAWFRGEVAKALHGEFNTFDEEPHL